MCLIFVGVTTFENILITKIFLLTVFPNLYFAHNIDTRMVEKECVYCGNQLTYWNLSRRMCQYEILNVYLFMHLLLPCVLLLPALSTMFWLWSGLSRMLLLAVYI